MKLEPATNYAFMEELSAEPLVCVGKDGREVAVRKVRC